MQIPYIYGGFLSPNENVVFKQILHIGQWKCIFRLVETIPFPYLKYLLHWKQFIHLLETYFKRILYYNQWQRISCLLETIFFIQIFLETIIAIGGRPIFKKKSYFCYCRGNRFLQFFFRY